MKKIMINARTSEKRIAIIEQGKPVEFMIDKPGHDDMVGNIYIGKVTKVLPGMDAAFVDIGNGRNGFLPKNQVLSFKQSSLDKEKQSITHYLHEGEKMLVQVKKEAVGTKGPRLSGIIELPGKYVVYLPEGNYIAVSRKMEDENVRQHWRQFANQLCKKKEGLIIRTACQGVRKEVIIKEIDLLRKQWQTILERVKKQKVPSLIYKNSSIYNRMVRDVKLDDVDEVIVDDRTLLQRLREQIAVYSDLNIDTTLYSGKEDIFSYYQIENELFKALKTHVWLKNGANIKIEQTEALTIIDVNTSKFTGRGEKEETVVKTNMEASIEIAKQLRLRNIGGIIIIDFIDMKEKISREKVLMTLQQALKSDSKLTKIIGFTGLGLLEMTRKKERKSLSETFLKQCPVCSGTGRVESDETLAFRVERKLWEYKGMDHEAIWIEAPKRTIELLTDNGHLQTLEKTLNYKIYLTKAEDYIRSFDVRHIGSIKEVEKRIKNND